MKARLTCKLTGESRQSSHKYIAKKAEQNGTTSEDYVDHYVTKAAYGTLKRELSDKSVRVVLDGLGLNGQTVEKILKYNGKSKKTLDDFKNQTSSSQQPNEQPAVQAVQQTQPVQQQETVGA
jgi:hypothetical protein